MGKVKCIEEPAINAKVASLTHSSGSVSNNTKLITAQYAVCTQTSYTNLTQRPASDLPQIGREMTDCAHSDCLSRGESLLDEPNNIESAEQVKLLGKEGSNCRVIEAPNVFYSCQLLYSATSSTTFALPISLSSPDSDLSPVVITLFCLYFVVYTIWLLKLNECCRYYAIRIPVYLCLYRLCTVQVRVCLKSIHRN